MHITLLVFVLMTYIDNTNCLHVMSLLCGHLALQLLLNTSCHNTLINLDLPALLVSVVHDQLSIYLLVPKQHAGILVV